MFVFYKIKKRLREMIYPRVVRSWRRKGLRRENHRYRTCVKIMSTILKYGKDNYITEGEIAEKVGVKKWCISKYISMLKSWKLVEVKLGRGGGVRFNKTGLPKDYIFFYKRCANSPIVQKEDKDIYKIINTSVPQNKILADINNKV